ncbi:MAG: hypothetical protein Q4C87_07040 [Actinomycetaceae bacterium]|nr:hypothetical protein [Actinomycetaceae bacterium]
MGNLGFGIVRLVAVVLLGGLFVCSGCSAPSAADAARPELLTVDEAMSGQAEMVAKPVWRMATDCGPDGWTTFPSYTGSDLVTFKQPGRRVTLGVWEDDPDRYSLALDDMKGRMDDLYCLSRREHEAKSPDGNVNNLADDWRVYPLDFGEEVAAFRSVTWRKEDGPPPSTPTPTEKVHIYSTARAYGVVDGKFVMATIDSLGPEPPSERELRGLWDAQVAKVRFHDAAKESRKRLAPQSGSIGTPASE